MSYTNEELEFAIRLLNHREELTEEEIRSWLALPGHRRLVDELAAIRKILSAGEERQGKTEELLLWQKRKKAQKRRRILIGWSAAAATVLIGVFSWNFFSASDHAPSAQPTNKKFVELTLASGEQIILDSQNEPAAEIGIPYDSLKGLDYTATHLALSDSTNEETFNTLRTPTGSAYQMTLADGTQVWVNENTVIRYPVAFKSEERRVQLRGEAYFDVAHDGEHPFLVETDGVEVKVYGTEFNVNAYDSTRIQTVLVEGKVGMRVNETGEEVVLKPRQLAEYDKAASHISVTEVSPYAHIAWKNGEFVFDNTTIEEIMERLATWYGIEVFYASEGAKQVRFSGILDRNDAFKDCLKRMESTGTIHFSVNDRSVTVYKN